MEQSTLQQTSFAPMPIGAGDTAITLGRGWLMVLVTEDPIRQVSAARLLTWWLTPQQNAALSQAMNWLPPGRAAFAQWQRDGRYYPFVQAQLESAQPQPALPPTRAEALSAAIGQVLRGDQTAQEAAAQVMAKVSPQ
jgi:ABC-type glycerol-3-phosphate transport system substrate-binding protein